MATDRRWNAKKPSPKRWWCPTRWPEDEVRLVPHMVSHLPSNHSNPFCFLSFLSLFLCGAPHFLLWLITRLSSTCTKHMIMNWLHIMWCPLLSLLLTAVHHHLLSDRITDLFWPLGALADGMFPLSAVFDSFWDSSSAFLPLPLVAWYNAHTHRIPRSVRRLHRSCRVCRLPRFWLPVCIHDRESTSRSVCSSGAQFHPELGCIFSLLPLSLRFQNPKYTIT